jgi:hypothetical protein
MPGVIWRGNNPHRADVDTWDDPQLPHLDDQLLIDLPQRIVSVSKFGHVGHGRRPVRPKSSFPLDIVDA